MYCPDYQLDPPEPSGREERINKAILRAEEIREENHRMRRIYRQNKEEREKLLTYLEQEGCDIGGL